MKKDWKKSGRMFVLALGTLALPSVATAQDSESSFSAGADLVSSYVWRGFAQDITNKQSPNLQPYVSFSTGKFTLGAWGSTSFTGSVKEVDLYATFAFSDALSLTLTDYNWGFTQGYFQLGSGTDHVFEATLAYAGSESLPLSASVNTMFAGNDKTASGDQAFSTYLELGYALGDNVKFFAGGSILNTPMYGGAGLTNLGVKVSKSIALTDQFSLPLYGIFGVNPSSSDAFIVVGLSL